jgi:protein-tyrosine-phosphatase
MKKRVLFLCTGNAARSQMAEALARLDHGDVLDVVSAGSRPAFEVHSMAIEVMNELGADMLGARPKFAGDYLAQTFDAVVTVCDHAAQDCPSWPGAVRVEHWSIEDPSFTPPPSRKQSFRETRDELRRRISRLVEELTAEEARASLDNRPLI